MTVTSAEAAAHLGIDEAEFLRLVERGIIKRTSTGVDRDPATVGATLSEAARHINLSEDQFLKLIRAGVIAPPAYVERKIYSARDLDLLRANYLRHLRLLAHAAADTPTWRR